MKRISKNTVDGITVLSLFIDGRFIMDCEVHSDFSEKEIREFFKNY
jgi:hypothetical protein